MTTNPSNSVTKPSAADICQQRKNAIAAYAANEPSILIDGTPYKPADLEAIYQRCIDTRATLILKRNEATVALDARRQADADRKTVDKGLLQWAVARFGAGSKQAKDFGHVPPKPRKPTAATKAAAVSKAKATRTARHTMGPNQKKGVKGAPPPSPAPANEPAPVPPVPTKG